MSRVIAPTILGRVDSVRPIERSDPRFPVGTTIGGRYVLRRIVGSGGTATVFAAENVAVRRLVALKLPLDNPREREALDARLRREVLALARVRHPAIVDVVDAGEFDSVPFLAMELLEGRTLSGLLTARGRLDPDEVVKIGVELASGLGGVHSAGIIHRDVKPSNVFVTRYSANQVRLLDFGTAKFVDEANMEKLTQLGGVVGTLEYMAPEALLCHPGADHRMDVYSLGVTLYELLAGAVPFEGGVGQVLAKLTSSEPRSLSELRGDVPKALQDVIAKCLRCDPQERYRDIAELGTALAACSSRPLSTLDLLRGTAESRAQAPALVPAKGPPPLPKQRVHARAPYMTLARVFPGQQKPFDGRLEDISEGGVLFVSEETCPEGEQVRLMFALPISGRVVDVSALARWNRAYRRMRATGFEYTDLPIEAREEIRRYVTLMGT
jgi:serine/threonine protein kinase